MPTTPRVVIGRPRAEPVRGRQSTSALPLAMLTVGSVTFVASVSMALTLQVQSGHPVGPQRSATSSHSPAGAPPAVALPVAPAPAQVPSGPAQVLPVAPLESVAVPDAVPDQIATLVPQAPVDQVPEAVQTIAAAPAAPPAADAGPPAASENPTLRSRILDRLRGMGQLVPQLPTR